MKSLYNFGASHAAGYGANTSYSKIISERLGTKHVELARAGSSTEHLLMTLQLNARHISTDDAVLIQLQPHYMHTLHYDARYDDRLYHYNAMTLLDREPDSDFVYGLKLYKTFVNTPVDQLLHYLIHINSIFDIIDKLDCKKFIFFDHIFRFPETSIQIILQLIDMVKSRDIADREIYTDFARALPFDDKYSKLSDGSMDNIHFNDRVHTEWAQYILTKL